MILVAPESSTSIQRLVEKQINSQPTYADIGASLRGTTPAGFHRDRYLRTLGEGVETFEYAKEGLRNWQAHTGPGVQVLPRETEIQSGATVIVTLGWFVALAAPCRIVEVVDEPRRWGFAYGTLPGHPEHVKRHSSSHGPPTTLSVLRSRRSPGLQVALCASLDLSHAASSGTGPTDT